MWTSGLRTFCSKCWGTDFDLVQETFDTLDLVYVGTQVCKGCGASLLYSRPGMSPKARRTKKGKCEQLPLPLEAD